MNPIPLAASSSASKSSGENNSPKSMFSTKFLLSLPEYYETSMCSNIKTKALAIPSSSFEVVLCFSKSYYYTMWITSLELLSNLNEDFSWSSVIALHKSFLLEIIAIGISFDFITFFKLLNTFISVVFSIFLYFQWANLHLNPI